MKLSTILTLAALFAVSNSALFGAKFIRGSVNAGSKSGPMKASLGSARYAKGASPKAAAINAPSPQKPKAPELESATADFNFQWGEVYSFPNPASKGTPPTIHIESGIADSVTLRIYDVAGELVHQAEITSPPTLVDDGQGPQYAYEYSWNGNVASGVYVCAIRAKKNGRPDLSKIIKLAVIK